MIGTSANSSGVLTRALIPVRFATASPGTPSAITIAAHNPSWLDPFAISLHAISATTRHPNRHAESGRSHSRKAYSPRLRGDWFCGWFSHREGSRRSRWS